MAIDLVKVLGEAVLQVVIIVMKNKMKEGKK